MLYSKVMLILVGILLFFLGAAVGSFLNVLVHRSIKKENWVSKRSKCEKCKRQLPWYENIPLLSFIFLRGKCFKCKKKIDIIHPIIELITGSLFVWWAFMGYWFFKLTASPLQYIQPLFWLLVGLIFVVIFIADIKHKIIPDEATILLLVAVLIYRLALVGTGVMQWADLGWSLVWSAILTSFFISLWLITKKKGFGFGDVKLALPLGLLMGSWQRIIVGIFFAFASGAVVGLFLIGTGKKKFKQAVPFGPFLLLGTVVGLIWGFEIWEGYMVLLRGGL